MTALQVLADQDIEAQTGENDESPSDIAMDDYLGDVEEATTRVKLPTDAANGNRSVSGLCTICLCPYTSGEKITWSSKAGCQHAFHEDCIIQWLTKKEELKCPVCRQHYCEPIHMDDTFPLSEELLLGRFAVALDRARSHATRWSNVRNSGNRPFFVAFEPRVVRVNVTGGSNDPSLREHSEVRSRDLEVGLVIPSEMASTANANYGGDVEMEEVTNLNTVAETNAKDESELGEDFVGERGAVGQQPEMNVDTNRDGEIEVEEVDVSDANNIAGLTEERTRTDS